MATEVSRLAQAAGHAANAGRWREAEALWQRVVVADPAHPQALCSLGIHALQRGDSGEARELLAAARAVAPQDIVVLMALGRACRQHGDLEGEHEAVEAALTADPYCLPALLARASWFERTGRRRAAVATCRNALQIAPPRASWPAALMPELEHAVRIVERHSAALGEHLEEQLSDLRQRLPPPLAERWGEAVAIRAGRSRPFTSRSNQLHVPRLPAIPFFDKEGFPPLAMLEARTEAIREELMNVLDSPGVQPYIAYDPGEPVNQWQALNHSTRWSAFHLWRSGSPVEENLTRCPETAKAIAAADMAEIDGLCPNALFSILAPQTRIPPHNGETNARLVAHLPLVVPDGCRFRVGFEERQWRVGETLVFDDTIEHEARNDSEELRAVLIFDLWNPLLEPVERELVRAMARSTRVFDPVP
jgi:aspartate beta-hydroxylase